MALKKNHTTPKFDFCFPQLFLTLCQNLHSPEYFWTIGLDWAFNGRGERVKEKNDFIIKFHHINYFILED